MFCAYCRTGVKPHTLFPSWHEHFTLPGVTNLYAQTVHVVVKDSASGRCHDTNDSAVGYVSVPLSVPLLRDQLKHSLWMPLQTAIKGPKLPPTCAIKVQ
ncbi:hypothetical protein B484DRAFT_392288, partial [Ochromonadaceae sp. CCMP2298]